MKNNIENTDPLSIQEDPLNPYNDWDDDMDELINDDEFCECNNNPCRWWRYKNERIQNGTNYKKNPKPTYKNHR